LLGSSKEFTNFVKGLANRPHNPYGPLRELVRPYILRRLKTDKAVIADLPDKTEVKAFCQLSRKQAALYEQSVKELAKQLQEAEGVGFFVLSLKAGGAGLNLTAASHVVHFDRWWNPAVENQATDRAFRIGQTKNVLVHKFVCRGTVEDKIDQLIESKRQLSTDLLEGGADLLLTEMKDEELLKLVALDINKALKET